MIHRHRAHADAASAGRRQKLLFLHAHVHWSPQEAVVLSGPIRVMRPTLQCMPWTTFCKCESRGGMGASARTAVHFTGIFHTGVHACMYVNTHACEHCTAYIQAGATATPAAYVNGGSSKRAPVQVHGSGGAGWGAAPPDPTRGAGAGVERRRNIHTERGHNHRAATAAKPSSHLHHRGTIICKSNTYHTFHSCT